MRVWVIGGTSGIGAAVADKVEAMSEAYPHTVLRTGVKEADVRQRTALAEAWEEHGPFDHVVYSAGTNKLAWIQDLDPLVALDIYNVNVVGLMRLLRVLATAQYSPCKSVTVISSDAATRPMRTSIAYCASKAALDMAVLCAARELAPLRVNAVSPGMTADTGMTVYIDATVPGLRGWDPAYARKYEQSQIPLQRRARPDEVADVVWSVMTGPSYMTGSIVTVNGGR